MKMEEWKEYKLTEIMELIGGGTPKTSNPDYWDGDIPWISVKDFNGERRYVGETEKKITKLGLENSSTKILSKGDIIISARGTVGELAIIPSDMAFNQSCYGLRAKDFVDSSFLYYLLKQSVNILKHNTHGSVFDTITRETFENISVNLPPLPTQQKIAAILSSLDDKIELNNKINTNLEQQAQALFKNFSEKSSKSVKFTDLIYILGGGTPKTNNEDYWNGKIPFFTPKDVGNPYCLLTEKKITESGLDNCNSRLYPVNTIFVTARGTVGKVCLAGLPMAMNQSCYALKSKDDNQLLAYFYTLEAINSLKHKANGATFDAIVTRDFETETINILSEQDTKEFTQIVKPIFEKILTNQKENINLSNLRDTLLPKLMNGEIEV